MDPVSHYQPPANYHSQNDQTRMNSVRFIPSFAQIDLHSNKTLTFKKVNNNEIYQHDYKTELDFFEPTIKNIHVPNSRNLNNQNPDQQSINASSYHFVSSYSLKVKEPNKPSGQILNDHHRIRINNQPQFSSSKIDHTFENDILKTLNDLSSPEKHEDKFLFEIQHI